MKREETPAALVSVARWPEPLDKQAGYHITNIYLTLLSSTDRESTEKVRGWFLNLSATTITFSEATTTEKHTHKDEYINKANFLNGHSLHISTHPQTPNLLL